jgi:hypothetical protein
MKEYWPLAFLLLYPYGKGYCEKLGNTLEYTRHTLERGSGRDFGKSAAYIFTRYHHETRRRMGGICSIMAAKSKGCGLTETDKSEAAAEDVTAADIRSIIDMQREKTTEEVLFNGSKDKVTKVLQRMTPYGNAIPGTLPHIKHAKNQVLAMINSPVILEEGEFTWFSTVAFADAFDPLLYAIAVDETSEEVQACLGSNHDIETEYETRHKVASRLSAPQRRSILKEHPVLACRLFSLKQDAILKVVLMGKDAPLGGYVD